MVRSLPRYPRLGVGRAQGEICARVLAVVEAGAAGGRLGNRVGARIVQEPARVARLDLYEAKLVLQHRRDLSRSRVGQIAGLEHVARIDRLARIDDGLTAVRAEVEIEPLGDERVLDAEVALMEHLAVALVLEIDGLQRVVEERRKIASLVG